MKENTISEVIQCPNFTWKLFQRDGVYYADGRRHGHGKSSLGTRSRPKAIKEIFELDQIVVNSEKHNEAFIATSVPPEILQGKSLPIALGWERYVKHRDLPIHLGGLKPSSIRKYSGHKKRLKRYCQSVGRDDWTKVNKELLRSYAKSLDGNLAPVTIHDDLTMEISVSSWLIKEGLIPPSCKIDWKLQNPAGAERYCYERDEVTRMLQLSKPFKKNRWLYPTILLLSRTGIRIGEAQNLKWSDIDLKHEVVHIRDESFANIAPNQRSHVKDGESRVIPLTTDLLAHLIGNKKATRYVLIGDRGRQLNYNHIREALSNRSSNR